MGELIAAGDVADGKDAFVRRAQAGVDADALLVVGDAGGLQIEPIDIGRPPGGDEQLRACDRRLDAVALDDHGDAVAGRRDPLDANAFMQRNALVGEPRLDDGREVPIVAAEHGEHLQHRHLGAEPAVRLRHLDTDRAAADDDQVRRAFGIVEDRLVRLVGHRIEARDRRRRRRRAVATTKRRARTRVPSSASTSRGPVKRADWVSTLTPSSSNRSTLSWGAIAPMTPCTWSCTARNATSGRAAIDAHDTGMVELRGGAAGGDQRLRRQRSHS